MKNLISLLFFYSICSFSQVGINTVTPDASSVFDVTSSNKGILIPRIALSATTDVTTITSPATSLLIYNTATVSDVLPGYYYWDGVQWTKLLTNNAIDTKWDTLGNSGTDDTVNFIGTTDDEDLVFKRNNVFAGVIDASNTGFGVNTLSSVVIARRLTAIGLNALSANANGFENTASGADALSSNTTGSYNTATGANALSANTTGAYNTAMGLNSLTANTTGLRNTGVGSNSLY
ncbi:hypothetical protein [Algibacter lectus]|uniref:Hep_Hag n=1 Tax=Algibacter lectus TaxID=221126 RepID=A0A4R8MHK1_9FLAO|nr:hypothetical protein [Algibacter lectus]MWW23479.1 hypothetical protein [Algibacter lectus]TDY63842.1 hypothetical protein DFQ06_0736 [Algibacter lectus]